MIRKVLMFCTQKNLSSASRSFSSVLHVPHQTNVFHPRLHDGLIPLCKLHRRTLATFNSPEHEEFDDLYRLISIEVKGHDKAVLKSYVRFICTASEELDLNLTNVHNIKPHFWRRTLNKAVFASKRAKVQYEIRTHYSIVEVKHLTGSTASVFLEYIQRNLPEGCSMKVNKHKFHQLPESIQESKEVQ